ncbi:AraC family transcriptional regulator [Bacillus subtilis subsp. subtilis]|nr:AraC family transcriptional regulator [Bacillus subtilis subsp. subtilis]
MSAARRALWYIESHHAAPIALADVARVVGVSPFHLSRLFQASTGTSLVRYLRGRRLSEAARQLAGGARDILPVALDAGYASHATFTRAFSEQFGRPPEQVRMQGLDSITLVPAIKLHDDALPCVHPPRIVNATPLQVAGIGARHRGDSVAAIPSQWQRLALQCPAAPELRYGVCCNSDDDGSFDYIAGIGVTGTAALPDGWQAVRIPARRYVVAWHAGHISAIRSTWYWLLNHHLPAAGLSLGDAPELERYDARFDAGSGHGGMEIWLPLADPDPS